ncbi:MAG: hypothetical protein J7M05_01260, partial [Anaerolineae bacterium]|nr:hypothetical protein [Anaerolineae bacterium]
MRQKEQAQEEEWSPSLWEDLGEEEEEEFEEEAFPYPEESLPPQALSFEEESPTLEEGEPLEEERPLEPLEIIEEEPEEEQRPVASEETRGPAEQVREDIPPDALGVFEAEYQYGDDDFDLAFTIEAAGEFLGECGLSVCDVLEVPEEGGQKVDAFEVWLFDKDDVETVSKVLVSPYVYQDEALNVELGARGELVVAQPGAAFSLETKNLQLSVTVEEAEYLQDEEIPESAFAKLRVEFLVERANGLT